MAHSTALQTRWKIMLLMSAILMLALWLFYPGQSIVWKRQSRVSQVANSHKMALRRTPNITSCGSVCLTPHCIAAYESALGSSRRIPKIRHILWKSDRVSAYFAKQLKSWQAIHPDWKYVLWRDQDMEKFVAKHYPGVLTKFRGLPENIRRIDMIRYMILHRFGGVYADLDYVLVRPLDRFLKFPAVVTREVEAHAFLQFGMKDFPPPVLGNPAFMMSEPRHPFFQFSILQLAGRVVDHYYHFAGPMGLSYLLTQYTKDFNLAKLAVNPDGVVIVPASRTFYPFEGNSLVSSRSGYKSGIIQRLRDLCRGVKHSAPVNVTTYCKDVNNLDPIIDRNDPVFAIHDYNKPRSSYHPIGSPVFVENPVDIRGILPKVQMASALY